MAKDYKWQAKSDFKLYHFFCCGVMALDLPKNTTFEGFPSIA
jgi:hypothetical protein